MSHSTMRVLVVDEDRASRKSASRMLRHSTKRRRVSCRIDRSPPSDIALDALTKTNYHFLVLPAAVRPVNERICSELRFLAQSRGVVELPSLHKRIVDSLLDEWISQTRNAAIDFKFDREPFLRLGNVGSLKTPPSPRNDFAVGAEDERDFLEVSLSSETSGARHAAPTAALLRIHNDLLTFAEDGGSIKGLGSPRSPRRSPGPGSIEEVGASATGRSDWAGAQRHDTRQQRHDTEYQSTRKDSTVPSPMMEGSRNRRRTQQKYPKSQRTPDRRRRHGGHGTQVVGGANKSSGGAGATGGHGAGATSGHWSGVGRSWSAHQTRERERDEQKDVSSRDLDRTSGYAYERVAPAARRPAGNVTGMGGVGQQGSRSHRGSSDLGSGEVPRSRGGPIGLPDGGADLTGGGFGLLQLMMDAEQQDTESGGGGMARRWSAHARCGGSSATANDPVGTRERNGPALFPVGGTGRPASSSDLRGPLVWRGLGQGPVSMMCVLCINTLPASLDTTIQRLVAVAHTQRVLVTVDSFPSSQAAFSACRTTSYQLVLLEVCGGAAAAGGDPPMSAERTARTLTADLQLNAPIVVTGSALHLARYCTPALSGMAAVTLQTPLRKSDVSALYDRWAARLPAKQWRAMGLTPPSATAPLSSPAPPASASFASPRPTPLDAAMSGVAGGGTGAGGGAMEMSPALADRRLGAAADPPASAFTRRQRESTRRRRHQQPPQRRGVNGIMLPSLSVPLSSPTPTMAPLRAPALSSSQAVPVRNHPPTRHRRHHSAVSTHLLVESGGSGTSSSSDESEQSASQSNTARPHQRRHRLSASAPRSTPGRVHHPLAGSSDPRNLGGLGGADALYASRPRAQAGRRGDGIGDPGTKPATTSSVSSSSAAAAASAAAALQLQTGPSPPQLRNPSPAHRRQRTHRRSTAPVDDHGGGTSGGGSRGRQCRPPAPSSPSPTTSGGTSANGRRRPPSGGGGGAIGQRSAGSRDDSSDSSGPRRLAHRGDVRSSPSSGSDHKESGSSECASDTPDNDGYAALCTDAAAVPADEGDGGTSRGGGGRSGRALGASFSVDGLRPGFKALEADRQMASEEGEEATRPRLRSRFADDMRVTLVGSAPSSRAGSPVDGAPAGETQASSNAVVGAVSTSNRLGTMDGSDRFSKSGGGDNGSDGDGDGDGDGVDGGTPPRQNTRFQGWFHVPPSSVTDSGMGDLGPRSPRPDSPRNLGLGPRSRLMPELGELNEEEEEAEEDSDSSDSSINYFSPSVVETPALSGWRRRSTLLDSDSSGSDSDSDSGNDTFQPPSFQVQGWVNDTQDATLHVVRTPRPDSPRQPKSDRFHRLASSLAGVVETEEDDVPLISEFDDSGSW